VARILLATGDRREVAEQVTGGLALDGIRAGLTPDQKVLLVLSERRHGPVMIVGDGVNDAPALAQADVSFAMGAGAGSALSAADVTLLRNDLAAVAAAIDLSRATLGKIRQNLFFAFFFNALGIPLAAFGLLSPVIAGAAMAASSVTVVANALLLKRWRAPVAVSPSATTRGLQNSAAIVKEKAT
jgi:Cu+-exporting ATPase